MANKVTFEPTGEVVSDIYTDATFIFGNHAGERRRFEFARVTMDDRFPGQRDRVKAAKENLPALTVAIEKAIARGNLGQEPVNF